MEKIKNDQFEIKQIEDTPFAILTDNEKNEIWIILGNEKIKYVTSDKEAIECTKKYDWDVLGPVMVKIAQQAAIETYYKTKKD